MTVKELKSILNGFPDEATVTAWMPWEEDWDVDEPTPRAYRDVTFDPRYVADQGIVLTVEGERNA